MKLIPQEDLEQLLKFLDSVEPAKPVSPNKPPATKFCIEELPDRFVLDGILYRGKLDGVAWGKELLDNGNPYDQTNWLALQKEGQLGEYSLADAQLYTASILTLYQNREGPYKKSIEKIRAMFADDFAKHYMMTSSRIFYPASGKDVIKHNAGLEDEFIVSGDFIGPDGWINASNSFGDIIPALTGTNDLCELEQAYHWASGKKPYLFRFNRKPKNDTEGAVVLGVGNCGWFSLVDYVQWPSRGVVRRRES